MKFSIEWHRNCLKNGKTSNQIDYEWAMRKLVRSEARAKELAFYEKQIEEAERRGMREFDSEKLLVKRGNNKATTIEGKESK